jgi:hypothetical protein
MNIVISQSMYFPWVGLLEQIRLADIFVHYDDVQFTRTGFSNRVQLKTARGIKWMTVPLRDHHLGQHINEVLIDNRIDWRTKHRDMLKQAYLKAPFRDEMLSLVDRIFNKDYEILADISRKSMLSMAKYFDLIGNKKFINSIKVTVPGSGSNRVHDICRKEGASVYLTGHGARNYLDHQLFEKSGIRVSYINYRMKPYPQLHGEFTPYVSALDLIANCGKAGADVIRSEAIYWKEFLNEPK